MARLPIDDMKELQQFIAGAVPEDAEFHLIVYVPEDGTVNAVRWWDKDPHRILRAERDILDRAGEGEPATELPAWLSAEEVDELQDGIRDLIPEDADFHLVVVPKDGNSCVIWWSEDPPMFKRLVREILDRAEKGEGESISADSPTWFKH